MLSGMALVGLAALYAGLAAARVEPKGNGNLQFCHSQTCDDCPLYASANHGYPDCYVYNTNNLPADFSSASGNGYDIWWNSGDPEPGCKIIVRSPAGFDLPACGYATRSWNTGGCYYTAINPPSFMLQYCCGVDDCDAASLTKRSIDEVHAAYLLGETSSTSLILEGIEGLTGEVAGTLDLGRIGDIVWRRRSLSNDSSEHPIPKRASNLLPPKALPAVPRGITEEDASTLGDVDASVPEKRCSDSFTLRERYSKGGKQVRASPTQSCNTDHCTVAAMGQSTEGYSIGFSVGYNIGVVESSLSTTFMRSETRGFSSSFSQQQGTNGFVSFIPAYDCYRGTYNNCEQGPGDGEACNPRILSNGNQDGTYVFVYV